MTTLSKYRVISDVEPDHLADTLNALHVDGFTDWQVMEQETTTVEIETIGWKWKTTTIRHTKYRVVAWTEDDE